MNQSNQKQTIEYNLPRKLTAILQADVVEYSRLMEVDEAGTLAQLTQHRRKFVEPTISAYHGRIVKLMGDGVLVEFPSVVEAVVCALKIQAGMDERNRNISSSQQVRFRVGINLGDVIVEGEDIHGDGVNITARLEALADPGGLCISGIVFDMIHNKLSLQYDFMGKQTVKNIANPLRIYRVQPKPGAILPGPGGSHTNKSKNRLFRVISRFAAFVLIVGTLILFNNKTLELHLNSIDSGGYTQQLPTLTIAPFTNMSGNSNHKHFSVDLSEGIVSNLSKLLSLKVVAASSYSTGERASEGGEQDEGNPSAQYTLQGSARKDGERVHVTVELVETHSGRHLWVEQYDREIKDIIAVQNDITEKVASTLSGSPS